MILIADSGATKTDWRLIEGKETVSSFSTDGINPAVMGEESINKILWNVKNLLEGLSPGKVRFYGAGVIGDSFKKTLEGFFPGAAVECADDLVGACRALWGDRPGIAVILGTGSNSCEWDGAGIRRHTGCGGFILGDEGGASNIGKTLLADYIKGLVPEDVAKALEEDYKARSGEELNYGNIVKHVYKSPTPSAWVAGFGPFITSRIGEPYADSILKDCFKKFIARNLYSYDKSLEVGVVGSLGSICADYVKEAGEAQGFKVVKFIKSPIDELVRYHSAE